MTISVKKFTVKDMYILLYFTTFIIHYFTNLSFNITYIAWIVMGFMGALLMKKELLQYKKIFLAFVLVDIIAMLDIILTMNHSPFNAFMLPVSQIIGLYLYKNRKHIDILVRLLYIIMAFMLIYIIITPKKLINEQLNTYYTYFSKLVVGNTISIFLIMFLIIDIIYRESTNKSINYLWIVLSLFMAYEGGGTGGVLSISILLLGMICKQWNRDKFSFSKMLIVITVGFIIISNLGYWNKLISELTNSNSRFWIWQRYFERCKSSVYDFIFGANVSSVSFLALQGNMHNTFINWHYYYGIIPQMFFLYMVVVTMFNSFIQKKYILLLTLCVLFIRGFTDETTFCFMPLWTYAYLYIRDHKNISSQYKLK